ncbi:SHOCT domain-containing protein [uncultured Megasphaera sp.]|uniref:SHOCT domain-containing protein n=1 Tax=Megasphaera massiliensis TaxID=1232428 RepID=UPI00260219F7|nr:SHOCT domain-containing protein [uncultured Megasphaera sp.]
MATAIGSSVPMPVISSTDSGVSAMDKRLFRNEATFQVTMYLARVMLAEKLITEKEYQTFEQEMLHKYQPFSGDLYTC